MASSNFSEEGTILNSQIDRMWLPDLYILNEKKSEKSDVTVSNFAIRINKTGDILYSLRVTTKLGCDMDLHLYPFDVQRCPLQLSSCKY